MAITISVDDWRISNVSVESITETFYSESIQGKGNSIGTGQHRYKIKFSITLNTADEVRAFEALMLQIRGQQNPFYLDLGDESNWFNPFSIPLSGSILTTVPASTGNNTISINNTLLIPVGAKFTQPNDTKVYQVIGKSGSSITIFPSLRFPLSTGTVLNFRNPQPYLRLNSNSFTLTYERAQEISLTALEVL